MSAERHPTDRACFSDAEAGAGVPKAPDTPDTAPRIQVLVGLRLASKPSLVRTENPKNRPARNHEKIKITVNPHCKGGGSQKSDQYRCVASEPRHAVESASSLG